MTQERSSPEFVGVRRSSSGFVGAEFATWKCCCQSGKTGYKNAILLSACCFSMLFRGENVKTHVGRRKCLDIFARKVKFVGVCRAESFTDCVNIKIFTKSVTNILFQGQIETGNSYWSAGPPGSVLCISADLIPYEPASSRKKPRSREATGQAEKPRSQKAQRMTRMKCMKGI